MESEPEGAYTAAVDSLDGLGGKAAKAQRQVLLQNMQEL